MKRLIAFLVFVVTGALAQNPATRFYRLDYVVKELEGGKVINSRAYSTTLPGNLDNKGASIRTGSRVPYEATPNSIQYYDLGVNIDSVVSMPQQAEGTLQIRITADISAAATETLAGAKAPVVRQNRWSSDVLVQLGKPTLVFSSDDPSTKRTSQLELTATLVR